MLRIHHQLYFQSSATKNTACCVSVFLKVSSYPAKRMKRPLDNTELPCKGRVINKRSSATLQKINSNLQITMTTRNACVLNLLDKNRCPSIRLTQGLKKRLSKKYERMRISCWPPLLMFYLGCAETVS